MGGQNNGGFMSVKSSNNMFNKTMSSELKNGFLMEECSFKGNNFSQGMDFRSM